jgi:hypothetical protein
MKFASAPIICTIVCTQLKFTVCESPVDTEGGIHMPEVISAEDLTSLESASESSDYEASMPHPFPVPSTSVPGLVEKSAMSRARAVVSDSVGALSRFKGPIYAYSAQLMMFQRDLLAKVPYQMELLVGVLCLLAVAIVIKVYRSGQPRPLQASTLKYSSMYKYPQFGGYDSQIRRREEDFL